MTSGRPLHRSRRGLNADAFTRLLVRFDPDRETAAHTYERLRQKLTLFFDWRGVVDPEHAADETFDRVARRLEQNEAVDNVTAYLFGTARLVLKEITRGQQQHLDALAGLAEGQAAKPEPRADRLERCLDICLGSLSAHNRELILEYHAADGALRRTRHTALAARLGLSGGALRVAAYRIRMALERCLERCLADEGGAL